VARVLRQVFLVDDLGVLERVLERLDAVATERVVLRHRRDRDVALVERDRVRDRVLRAVAAGAEDVLVPLVAGDRVGDRGLDVGDFLVFLGHRQARAVPWLSFSMLTSFLPATIIVPLVA